jgi:hypothetical protein
MRLPEFLLTRSVLRFLKNVKTGVAADLNLVRKRAGLDVIDDNSLT